MKNEQIYNAMYEQTTYYNAVEPPTYITGVEQQDSEGDGSFAALMAMTVGLLSVLAAGGTINGDMVELLPLVTAAAAPGLIAWVLSYLSAKSAIEEQEVSNLG